MRSKIQTVVGLTAWCMAVGGARLLEAESTPVRADASVRETSPGVYQVGKIRFNKRERSVSFPATLNMVDGLLEYALVTPEGSVHESLLVTDVQPSDLHAVLLLLGVKTGTPLAPDAAPGPSRIDAEMLKSAPRLSGAPVLVLLSWDSGGQQQKASLEDWIWNGKTGAAAERGPWVYNGSRVLGRTFAAQEEGNLVSLVTNPSALVNNPRPGSDDDQLWTPNKPALPPQGTPLEVTFQLEAQPPNSTPAPSNAHLPK